MLPSNLWRKPYVQNPKAKHRASVPFRHPEQLTSFIFLSPVTLITTHPGNKVRCGPQEDKLEKPQQLCASLKLHAVKHQGTEEEWLSHLDFENTLKYWL